MKSVAFILTLMSFSPIETNRDEADYAINNAETDRSYDEKYKAFNDKFNYLDDGKAAQRVTEAIIEE